ncbi:MAG: hypothetical protein LBL30_01330 [Holosporales bacterium]|nr:hypothetical protein [Holosporales bacterium]
MLLVQISPVRKSAIEETVKAFESCVSKPKLDESKYCLGYRQFTDP